MGIVTPVILFESMVDEAKRDKRRLEDAFVAAALLKRGELYNAESNQVNRMITNALVKAVSRLATIEGATCPLPNTAWETLQASRG